MDYVQGKIPEPLSNALATAKTKYNKDEVKVKKIIMDSIDKHLVAYISELKTSKDIYDKLVDMFKDSNANQILFVNNKLSDIKKGKDRDIQFYFFRITEIKNDLLSIGEVIPDRELTLTTLGGLPPEWYVFRTTILNNNRIQGFEELMFGCIQEEMRMVEQEMASNRSNPTGLHSCQEEEQCGFKEAKSRKTEIQKYDDYHNNSRGSFNKNDQRNDRFNGKGKRNAGHQGNGRPSKKSRNSRYEESNVVNNKKKEYYLISTLSTTSPLDTLENWMIDSGASRNFTGYKEALSNLIEKETNLEIILGDDATYPVKGVGNVTLQLNQGNTIHLQEVLYVPDLKKNKVSISTMTDKGFKVAFIDGKVRVWKIIFKDAFTLGFRVDTLYQVGGSPLGAITCDTSYNLNYGT
eukprot:PITA_14798